MIDNGYIGDGGVGIAVVIVAVGVGAGSCVSASTGPPGTLGIVSDDRRDDTRDGGRIWEGVLADIVQRVRGLG